MFPFFLLLLSLLLLLLFFPLLHYCWFPVLVSRSPPSQLLAFVFCWMSMTSSRPHLSSSTCLKRLPQRLHYCVVSLLYYLSSSTVGSTIIKIGEKKEFVTCWEQKQSSFFFLPHSTAPLTMFFTPPTFRVRRLTVTHVFRFHFRFFLILFLYQKETQSANAERWRTAESEHCKALKLHNRIKMKSKAKELVFFPFLLKKRRTTSYGEPVSLVGTEQEVK